MPYEVIYNESDGIVGVRVWGEATENEHYAAREEAFRLCREHDCIRLLVDLHELSTKHSTVNGCFSFGESLAKISPGIRIAHIMPTDSLSIKDVRFTTTVEANRGVQTCSFNTAEEARTWLLKREE
ncbi:MAG: hypothetical protein JW860_02505 [Sedimentisphaerales bacterium]|nr:hypothetical protein [Sedimentisphaerales bacterium]